MPSPIPALYVPTAAAREAARKAFDAKGLWCCGNAKATRDNWESWERYYGDTFHWMTDSQGASPHWQFSSLDNVAAHKATFTVVNSVNHFISAARARRAAK